MSLFESVRKYISEELGFFQTEEEEKRHKEWVRKYNKDQKKWREEVAQREAREQERDRILDKGKRAEEAILKFAENSDWIVVVRKERSRLISYYDRNPYSERMRALKRLDELEHSLRFVEEHNAEEVVQEAKEAVWSCYKKANPDIEDVNLKSTADPEWNIVIQKERNRLKTKYDHISKTIQAEKDRAWEEWGKLETNLKSAANQEEKDQAWEEYKKATHFIERPSTEEVKTAIEMERKGMGECVDCGKYTANRYAWWNHRDQVTQVLASQGQLKDYLCLDCLKRYGPIVSISHGPDGSEIRTEWDPAGAALKKALEKQKKENPENS